MLSFHCLWTDFFEHLNSWKIDNFWLFWIKWLNYNDKRLKLSPKIFGNKPLNISSKIRWAITNILSLPFCVISLYVEKVFYCQVFLWWISSNWSSLWKINLSNYRIVFYPVLQKDSCAVAGRIMLVTCPSDAS